MTTFPATETTSPATTTQKTSVAEQIGLSLAILLPFSITVYAAVALTRGTFSLTHVLAALCACSLANLGTTAGYHRMLTHQSFQAAPVVQYALLILGAVAGMGSPVKWAHDHMHHHSHSDTERDLHSPHTPRFNGKPLAGLRRWADAHMGWLFRYEPIKVSAKAREVTATPAARFVHRTANLWLIAGLVVPLCFGWSAFVWVGMVRLFLNHHITWSVNSICHVWGRQPFQNTRDQSKNNAVVGILAMGEGWHNNHHFRPASARHGLLPGQLDMTYAAICLLERCKLVWNVKRYALCSRCQDWHALAVGEKRVVCRKAV